jgi:hypothetical protein
MGALLTTSHGFRYRIKDFLDDERRLIAAGGECPSTDELIVEGLEGRLLVVDAGRLSQALAQDDASASFLEKYGDDQNAARRRRCLLVIDFLLRWRDEIVECGLASQANDPLAVREEFIDFLLNYDVTLESDPLPERALTAFLDQWGHRWL